MGTRYERMWSRISRGRSKNLGKSEPAIGIDRVRMDSDGGLVSGLHVVC